MVRHRRRRWCWGTDHTHFLALLLDHVVCHHYDQTATEDEVNEEVDKVLAELTVNVMQAVPAQPTTKVNKRAACLWWCHSKGKGTSGGLIDSVCRKLARPHHLVQPLSEGEVWWAIHRPSYHLSDATLNALPSPCSTDILWPGPEHHFPPFPLVQIQAPATATTEQTQEATQESAADAEAEELELKQMRERLNAL